MPTLKKLLLILLVILIIPAACEQDPLEKDIESITLTSDKDSIPADGESSTIITAKLNFTSEEAQANYQVEDIKVNFRTTLGTLTEEVVECNEFGMAATRLIAGDTLGDANVIAQSQAATATTTVQIVSDTQAVVSDFSASPNPVAPQQGVTLMARIVDADNQIIVGDNVQFLELQDESGNTFSSVVAKTDNYGWAKTTYTSGKTPGTDQFQAITSDGSKSSTLSVIVDADLIQIGSIDFDVVGNSYELDADGISSLALRATLEDIYGKPAVGYTVNFTITSGTLSASSAVTDGNGEAVVNVISSTNPAQITVTATAGNFSDVVYLQYVD